MIVETIIVPPVMKVYCADAGIKVRHTSKSRFATLFIVPLPNMANRALKFSFLFSALVNKSKTMEATSAVAAQRIEYSVALTFWNGAA